MDIHAYGPGQSGADSTCARDHRALCVSVDRPASAGLICSAINATYLPIQKRVWGRHWPSIYLFQRPFRGQQNPYRDYPVRSPNPGQAPPPTGAPASLAARSSATDHGQALGVVMRKKDRFTVLEETSRHIAYARARWRTKRMTKRSS